MTCPFKHVWASEPAAHASKLNPENNDNDLVADSTSKLASVTLKTGSENIDASGNTLPKGALATCPMGFGARADASSGGPSHASTTSSTAPPAAAATCPLGFGSSSGPKLTNLHCIICKSFLYDCVKTNCGHSYCRHCISRFRDCPTCGADVVSVESAPESQSLVETFLSAHAGDKSIWQIEGTTSKENEDEEDIGKAAFLLQVGVRALSGGNPASAAYRLSQCMNELETQLSDLGKEEENQLGCKKVELLNKMGAVAGCRGDCYRALGDAKQAIEQYTHSATLLGQVISYSHQSNSLEHEKESVSGSTTTTAAAGTEAVQSLSVTMNKIGEIYHLQGDLQHAVEKYKEALAVRQTRLKEIIRPVESGGEREHKNDGDQIKDHLYVEAAVDVAVSHVKVANVLETMLSERKEEGIDLEQQLREHEVAARELLKEIDSLIENEVKDGGKMEVQRKVEMLKTHLGN